MGLLGLSSALTEISKRELKYKIFSIGDLTRLFDDVSMKRVRTPQEEQVSCIEGASPSVGNVSCYTSQNALSDIKAERDGTLVLQVKDEGYRILAQRARKERCSVEMLVAKSIYALLEQVE